MKLGTGGMNHTRPKAINFEQNSIFTSMPGDKAD